jgi:Lysine 2,3-aminomutase
MKTKIIFLIYSIFITITTADDKAKTQMEMDTIHAQRHAQVEQLHTALSNLKTATEQAAVVAEFEKLRAGQQWHFLGKCIDNYADTNMSALIFDKTNPNGRRASMGRQSVWFVGKVVGKDFEPFLDIHATNKQINVWGTLWVGRADWYEEKLHALAREFLAKKTANQKLEFAKSLNTPDEVLKILAEDPDKNIRIAIAQNPNIHFDIISSLSKEDPDAEVRAAAQKICDSEEVGVHVGYDIDPILITIEQEGNSGANPRIRNKN